MEHDEDLILEKYENMNIYIYICIYTVYIVDKTKGLYHLGKNLTKYRLGMIIHPEIGSLWSKPKGKCH